MVLLTRGDLTCKRMVYVLLLASGSADDEGVNLADFAAPVGHFDLMPGAHDGYVAQVGIAEHDG
jgi:hypothetical protein